MAFTGLSSKKGDNRMKRQNSWILTAVMIIPLLLPAVEASAAGNVVRPEEIKSKRLVVYDNDTYVRLAGLWKDYYSAYPSEYAYANWMYAARYAGDKNYMKMLDEGLKKYPANPTLLYLKANERHGAANDTEGLRYLEKAISLDPNFVDPWFLLVTHYMDSRDQERLDLALRRLLESGIITDEVMDYNYNMLIGLDDNAILITNGDNDTYPGWILTRILKVRPDIAVVNRSLLNTEWYPIYIIENGLPRFTDKTQLENLRSSILQRIKQKKSSPSPGGPFGDTLVLKIIESAGRAGRPVYISKTVYLTEPLMDVIEQGRDLGLVTLVTPSRASYADQLRKVYRKWIEDFRTGGLESWRLRNAPETDAGRMLVTNYARGEVADLEALKKNVPEIRLALFKWYLEYMEKIIPEEMRAEIAQKWCHHAADVKEISDWTKLQGLKCE
jgi:hypothetical protein